MPANQGYMPLLRSFLCGVLQTCRASGAVDRFSCFWVFFEQAAGGNLFPLMKHFLHAILAVAFTQPVFAQYRPDPTKVLGFPIYTNERSVQHSPSGAPALSPEEAREKFIVADGFEMRLFASEPEVVNPIARRARRAQWHARRPAR